MPTKKSPSKLIRDLQRAHAGEIAAYHAYEGHWRIETPEVAKHIRSIQRDELRHISELRHILSQLGNGPDPIRDAIFWVIGKTVSGACRIFGRLLSARGACRIEVIGVKEYRAMSAHAHELGLHGIGLKLTAMGAIEGAHEWYFETLTRRGK